MVSQWLALGVTRFDLVWVILIPEPQSVPEIAKVKQEYAVPHNLINVGELVLEQFIVQLSCRTGKHDYGPDHDTAYAMLGKPFNVALEAYLGPAPAMVKD